MIFKTFTGSLYEVDHGEMRVRRIGGEKPPTARQGEDGEWTMIEEISPIEVGKSVIFVWKMEADNGLITLKTTVTSEVTEIVE